VEKIKRDAKITTIYEGTSEIQQLIISTFRWRSSVQSRFEFYGSLAERMEAVHAAYPDIKADVFATVVRLVNRVFEETHKVKATRQQYVMFHLATLATLAETGAALIAKAATAEHASVERADYLRSCARVNVALAAQAVFAVAGEILHGTGKWTAEEARAVLVSSGFDHAASQTGMILDMDALQSQVREGAFK
jgi:alkylation response protein AidB-like acyl-CoA dehydrogenase